MLKRIQAVVIAAVLGAGALALTPSAMASAGALAAPTVSSVEVSPGTVVVVSGAPVTAKFSFTTTNSPDNVELQLKPPGISVGTPLALESKDLGDGKKAWSARKTFDGDSAAGDWSLLAVASNADGSDSKGASVTVKRISETRIVGFDAEPDVVRKGNQVSLSGRLLIKGKDGWTGYAGQRVDLLFKADESYRWLRVDSDRTSHGGRFWAKVPARWSGWFRAEFDGNHEAKGSDSRADHVKVISPPPPPPKKASSRIIKFNAFYEPVKRGKYLRFTGKLQAWTDWGWDSYKSKVRIYVKATGSSKWRYVKTTWTVSSGKFFTKTKAFRSGTWKAVFTGDSDTKGSTSKGDYVRVKR